MAGVVLQHGIMSTAIHFMVALYGSRNANMSIEASLWLLHAAGSSCQSWNLGQFEIHLQ